MVNGKPYFMKPVTLEPVEGPGEVFTGYYYIYFEPQNGKLVDIEEDSWVITAEELDTNDFFFVGYLAQSSSDLPPTVGWENVHAGGPAPTLTINK